MKHFLIELCNNSLSTAKVIERQMKYSNDYER
jgi:hypothetical protein